jgi:hypothetical protein
MHANGHCCACYSISETVRAGGKELDSLLFTLDQNQFRMVHDAVKIAIAEGDKIDPTKLFVFSPGEMRDVVAGVKQASPVYSGGN